MFIDWAFLPILRSVRSDLSLGTHMALLPERKVTISVTAINILLLRSNAGQSSILLPKFASFKLERA